MTHLRAFVRTILPVLVLCLLAGVAAAQEASGASQPTRLAQPGMRAYWHVFAAYTIVLLVIGGWAVSIARRLSRIEERLGE